MTPPPTSPPLDGGASPDMTQAQAPPSNFWPSSGGGSAALPAASLGVSIGGTPVVGTATSGARSIVFGNLCTETF